MKLKLYPVILLLSVCSYSVNAQVINTVAGNGYGAGTGTGGYMGDNGLAMNAELNSCTDMAVDGAGNIYIADRGNNVVRKINTVGIITTFAGTGTAGYSGNGGQATAAKLNWPSAVTTDAAGNVYIADYNNNVVRIVSTAGVINTYAGNDTAAYSGDMGAANHASLNGPQGLAIDASGNLYIAEANNHVVRMVNSAGTISTIAGTGTFGYSGNGNAATLAKLHSPAAVAVDAAGNVYIADYFNNAIRKVDGAGNITTIAGNGTIGNSGDGAAASLALLHYPSGVTTDAAGNIYVSDQGNNTIRRISSSGTISRYAGIYTNGYTGDGDQAVACELSSPKGIKEDGWGRLYIADYDNNVIRVVAVSSAVSTVSTSAAIKLYPNPSNGNFNIELPEATTAVVSVMDMMGKIVATQKTGNAASKTITISMTNLPAGNYVVKISAGDKVYREKIVVSQ